MIGNIKETLLPKTDMWKKQVLQDQGMSDVSKVHAACCMEHYKVVWMSKVLKEIKQA